MEKNVMRSLEMVARERMEVAVRPLFEALTPGTQPPADLLPSNNSPSGASTATRTFRT
jgi:hypothetical protein